MEARKLLYLSISLLTLLLFVQQVIITSISKATAKTEQASLDAKEEARLIASLTLPYETVTPEQLAATYLGDAQARAAYTNNLLRFTSTQLDIYAARHRAVRANCAANAKAAAAARLLVYRGKARNYGLGDRVRGALSAYLLAMVTDRLLLLDLARPFPLDLLLQSPSGVSNFTYDPAVFLFRGGDAHVVRAKPAPGLPELLSDARVIDLRYMAPFNPASFLRNLTLFPHFRASLRAALIEETFEPRVADLAPLILRRLFAPTPYFRHRLHKRRPFGRVPLHINESLARSTLKVLTAQYRFFGIIPHPARGSFLEMALSKEPQLVDADYVGLHARMGTGVGESMGRFNVARRNLTLIQAALCAGRAAGRVAKRLRVSRVYVATDTAFVFPDLRKGVFETAGTGIDIRAAQGPVKHLRAMRYTTENPPFAGSMQGVDVIERKRRRSRKEKEEASVGASTSKRDGSGMTGEDDSDWEAFCTAFETVALLSRANAVVYFRSGFGDAASWMGADNEALQLDLRMCRNELDVLESGKEGWLGEKRARIK